MSTGAMVFSFIWNFAMAAIAGGLVVFARKISRSSEAKLARLNAELAEQAQRVEDSVLGAASAVALRREVARLRILRDYLLRLDDPANAGIRRAASLDSIIDMARATLMEDEADVSAD